MKYTLQTGGGDRASSWQLIRRMLRIRALGAVLAGNEKQPGEGQRDAEGGAAAHREG